VRQRVLALLALTLVLAVAGPAPARGEDDCAQQHRRVRLPRGFAAARLSFVAIATNGRSRVGEQFAGGDVRELRIVADWTEIESAHLQRLELFSPDGSLYQRLTGAFTASGRPVAVTTRLPVSGTAIVDAGLYGEWCVELFLDDEEAPIARRGFVLTPPSP
jgi:hypothetical protein